MLTMARYQGEEVDPWRDEEPGRDHADADCAVESLRETKSSPFIPYYGSIDVYDPVPGAYRRICEMDRRYGAAGDDASTYTPGTGMDRYSTAAGSAAAGFVAYFQQSEKGIANQGWKDSGNSVVHRTGLSPRRRSRWLRYKATCISRSGISRSCLTICGRNLAHQIGSNGPSV